MVKCIFVDIFKLTWIQQIFSFNQNRPLRSKRAKTTVISHPNLPCTPYQEPDLDNWHSGYGAACSLHMQQCCESVVGWIRNFFLDPYPKLLAPDPAKMEEQLNKYNFTVQPMFRLVRQKLYLYRKVGGSFLLVESRTFFLLRNS